MSRNVNVVKPLRVVFVLLLALALFMFMHSAFFAVTKINVLGAKQLRNQEILKISGLNTGVNIFKANLREAEDNIRLNPLVKDVEIKRRLPSSIVISVTEREAVGLLADRGDYLELDIDGVLLARTNLGKVSLPIITGAPVKKAAPGAKLDSDQIRAALSYLKNMPLKITATISEINVRDPNNIKFYTLDGAEVRVGDTERATEKIRLYEEVISQNYKKQVQYIDISYKGRPVIKYIEGKQDS